MKTQIINGGHFFDFLSSQLKLLERALLLPSVKA